MEIMYVNKEIDLIKDDRFVAINGDILDLINYGIEFNNIDYNDNYNVRRFLNGYKFKINEDIVNIFNELEINILLLKRKMKELSRGQLKLVLLVYLLINKKNIIVLDYFDKGLSLKYKKRIINYLKTKYEGKVLAISNDFIFLNQLCSKIIIFKNGKITFNNDFNKLYKSNSKLDYPEIIKFIKLANKKNVKLSYTVENHELLKDIYRSVTWDI